MTHHAEIDEAALALGATIKRELQAIRPRKLPDDWDDALPFKEGLGLDSLDLFEMIARLEQATGIFVPDPDLPKLWSVAATVRYIVERQGREA